MAILITVKPHPERQVRKEDGSVIAAEGTTVPSTKYYRRRIKEGDLVVVNMPTKQSNKKVSATADQGEK